MLKYEKMYLPWSMDQYSAFELFHTVFYTSKNFERPVRRFGILLRHQAMVILGRVLVGDDTWSFGSRLEAHAECIRRCLSRNICVKKSL